jgi:hypothetical protein
VALARSIFRADFVAALAFQFSPTNLVLELGIILTVLMGWEFVAAVFAGPDNDGAADRHATLCHDAPTGHRGRIAGCRAEPLAAEILGQLGCGALHRVSVGLRIVMAAAIDESVLRIRIGDELEGTAGGGRGESAGGLD